MDQFSYVVIGVGVLLFAAAGISYAMFRSFNSFIVFLWLAIADLIWGLFMGAPGNFKDAFGRHEPLNTLGTIHTGGPLVAALLGMLFIAITFIVERYLLINKAKGNGDLREFVKTVSTNLESGNVHNAIEACAKQQGSLSNIVRSALERYVQLENDSEYDAEKKLSEVQRAIDEATNLETPLLEKNLYSFYSSFYFYYGWTIRNNIRNDTFICSSWSKWWSGISTSFIYWYFRSLI